MSAKAKKPTARQMGRAFDQCEQLERLHEECGVVVTMRVTEHLQGGWSMCEDEQIEAWIKNVGEVFEGLELVLRHERERVEAEQEADELAEAA